MRFFVPGIPRPAGSKRPIVSKTTGRSFVVDSSGQKGKDWRGDVKRFAMDADYEKPLDCAVQLHVYFYLPRPKNHYRTNGNLKDWAPRHHTKRPDATKLLRAIEDALTGVCWTDDALIVRQRVEKCYVGLGRPVPGAVVEVLRA